MTLVAAAGDGTTDDSTIINSTITSANALGAAAGVVVEIDGGGKKYAVGSTIVHKSYVRLKNLELYLLDGKNVDVLKTPNFDTLVGGNTNVDDGSFTELENVRIDGNKANQSSAGRGICIYGRKHVWKNVEVRNTYGRGIHSEWYTAGDEMEAHVTGLRVVNAGSDGVYWNGPHDSTLDEVHIEKSGGRGLWQGPSAGGEQWGKVHSWGNTQDAIYSETTALFENTQAEGSPNGYFQLVLLGSNSTYRGRIFGTGATGGSAESGVALGDGSHTPTGLYVEAIFTGLNGKWVDFTHDGGRSQVHCVGTLGSGTRSTGTPSPRTVYSFSTENSDGADRFKAQNLLAGSAGSILLDQLGEITLFDTSNGVIRFVTQGAAPSAPTSGRVTLFQSPGGSLSAMYSDGTRRLLGARDVDYLNGGTVPFRESFDRRMFLAGLTTSMGLSSGVMLLSAVVLYEGDVISNLAFRSAGTGLTFGSDNNGHAWFALYDTGLNLLAQTADQTPTGGFTWASGTTKDIALSAAQTITTTGVYYAGVMVNAGTGGAPVQPSVRGLALLEAATETGYVTGQKALGGTNGSSLGASAPSGPIVLASVVNFPYVVAH